MRIVNESLLHNSPNGVVGAWQYNMQRNEDSRRGGGQTNDLIRDEIQGI